MNKLKHSKLVYSVLAVAVALLFGVVLILGLLPVPFVANAESAITDGSVDNYSSMSTDVIYQIVTDRFVDGDPSNNPTGEIYDKNNLRKYHGGDWEGITQKIEDGYFTDLGVTALWISSPVQNSDYIDPSNGCAPYHGYWGRDFFLPNQYFGSMDDFEELVDTAHSNDIKVIIDFAPNHTSFAVYDGVIQPNDGVLYKNGEYVSTYSNDPNGIFNHVSDQWAEFDTWEHTVYAPLFGLADLNQQNATTDQYLKDAIKVWLDAGVDGIRVDAVKHMSLGWQKNWVNSIYEYKPVFIFGEWSHSATTSEPNMENFANESGMSLLDFRYNTAIRNALANATTSGYSMVDFHNTMMDMEEDYDYINDQVTFLDNHPVTRVHVIIESVLDGRPDAELDARIKLLQCLGQQVRARVPESVLTLFIFPFIKDEAGIFVDRAVQIHRFAVHAAGQNLLRQTRADAFCNLQTGNSVAVLTHGAIRKSNLYHNVYIVYLFLIVCKII